MTQRKIAIFDTTLRDGEQSPGASMDASGKLVIANQLLKLGVDVIEAGFPASSPGDFESVRRIAELVADQASVCALSRAIPDDIQHAARALEGAMRPRIQTGIGVSQRHLSDKLFMTQEACLERIDQCVALARTYCDDVQFYAEDAARADRVFLAEAVRTALRAGATVVNIPDTTGYSLPESYGALIKYLFDEIPDLSKVTVSVHAHNDLGMATALTLAGVANGANQVECTINGIGERAGNAALEEVVMAIALHGDKLEAYTDVETRELTRSSKIVTSVTGVGIQANKAIVGANAFAHSSGIHQDGVLKARETYEIIDPSSVGAGVSSIVLTARSGHAALKNRFRELGYTFDDQKLDILYDRFLTLADRKTEVYDEDLESLVDELERSVSAIYTLEGLQMNCGFPLVPTATVTLRRVDGRIETVCSCGTGPIDAAYKAVDRIIGVPIDLIEFSVQSLTRGIDAVGDVIVRIKSEDGRIFIGRGADPDIVVSATKAYLNALNRLL